MYSRDVGTMNFVDEERIKVRRIAFVIVK